MLKELLQPGCTMGSDPEMFIVDRDNNVVPASKIGVRGSETDDNIVYDNAAVELRPSAFTCIEYVLPNLKGIVQDLYELVEDLGPGHDISFEPARRISPGILRESDGCMEFGCDPSQVYGKDGVRVSRPDVSPEETSVRSVGFHIHWGKNFDEEELEYWHEDRVKHTKIVHELPTQLKIIELADIFLGLVGVIMEKEYGEMVRWRRQELGYGVAGEFRQQPHGLEYRTLGPWPMRHLMWTWWAFSTARDCYYLVVNGLHEAVTDGIDRCDVIDAINSNDVESAIALWNKGRDNVLSIMEGFKQIRVGNQALVSKTNIKRLEYALATDGVETFFPNESMWESYADYRNHNGDCFPARLRKYNSRSLRSFRGSWELGRDNISNYQSNTDFDTVEVDDTTDNIHIERL